MKNAACGWIVCSVRDNIFQQTLSSRPQRRPFQEPEARRRSPAGRSRRPAGRPPGSSPDRPRKCQPRGRRYPAFGPYPSRAALSRQLDHEPPVRAQLGTYPEEPDARLRDERHPALGTAGQDGRGLGDPSPPRPVQGTGRRKPDPLKTADGIKTRYK